MSAAGRNRAGAVDGDAQAVRRRQLVLFSVIVAAVLIVLAAWLTAGGGKGPAPAGGIDAELAGPDTAEKVWTRRSEARIGAIETRLREMQGEARRLGAENERLRERLVGDAENARGVIDLQKAAIDELERRLRAVLPPEGAPGAGTALSVDIAGCTETGAAHGDLSSEKVYARLRTMTCAAPGSGERPGSVIETEVAGFVAGSGKTGVRGPVVSREGALVEKAFLAGLVSGIGQGVASAFQPQAVATGGAASVANTGLGDIGRAGLGAGAASAGQKVADYMVRRAEQYQPVIQLRAGTRVTLVFLEGARIGGTPRSHGRAAKPTQEDK